MAYINGSHQYFDNSFLYNVRDFHRPEKPRYDKNSLKGYLFNNHPKWFSIMEIADRLDFFQQGYFSLWTMFIPDESILSNLDIINMDRNTALKIFNYHTLKGFYNQNILKTSRYQELSTLIYGQTLKISDYDILNYSSKIIKYDIIHENVIIHIFSSL